MARAALAASVTVLTAGFLTDSWAQSPGESLPEGRAKAMVEGVCTGCHQTSEILRSSGYTRAGWAEITSTMVEVSASPAERDQVMEYLATHFPPNTKRSPRAVAGDAQISFREWQVPTLGQRSRDPVEGPDGTIWWAGQWANLIGRINPAPVLGGQGCLWW